MTMNYLDQVKKCYNLSAAEYADKFIDELAQKPFDRNILDRFSMMIPAGGKIYDYGCGPGQTTKYLHDKKRHEVTGLDIAEQPIRLAGERFPETTFAVDDMLNSGLPTRSANGILAFYAIVHFTLPDIKRAFGEWLRLLDDGGLCLFSFHVGSETIEITDFLDVSGASAVWRFLDVDAVLSLAEETGFEQVESIIRYPYKGVEHPSKRAYIILRKPEAKTE